MRFTGSAFTTAIVIVAVACSQGADQGDKESLDPPEPIAPAESALRKFAKSDPDAPSVDEVVSMAENADASGYLRCMAALALSQRQGVDDARVQELLLALCDDGLEPDRLSTSAAFAHETRFGVPTREIQSKFAIGTHWKVLTQPELMRRQWSTAAIDTVVNSNIATDLSWMALDWTLVPITYAYWSSYERIPDVRRHAATAPFNAFDPKLFPSEIDSADFPFRTVGFHFDDLFTYDAISARWSAMESWTVAQCRVIDNQWTKSGATDLLVLTGMTLHAVQDYYCHSNWVEIFTQAGVSPIPTWHEYHMSERSNAPDSSGVLSRLTSSNKRLSTRKETGGLQTGAWDVRVAQDPETGVPLKPWKHSHPTGDQRDACLVVARRATEAWIDRVVLGSLDAPYRVELLKWASQ